MRIRAKGVHYKDLNERIHKAVARGQEEILLDDINGQRYIGGGLKGNIHITINGVPGNDLASFMDGPTIIVNENAQDAVGNTMNAGKVVIRGDAGDIIGYAMRGGKIFIQGNVGYRVGIHMKSFKEKLPVIIVGGGAGDFLGEYMAGGLLVVLGLHQGSRHPFVGNYVGTGMHGGTIYVRGSVKDYQVGREVGIRRPTRKDMANLRKYLEEFCGDLGLDVERVLAKRFTKLIPYSSRPYGKLYAY
jgi:glutamate synthase domain-containing protein 3